MLIRKFADLSTAHLSPAAMAWLERQFQGKRDNYWWTGGRTAYGWFLWAPEQEGDEYDGCCDMPLDLRLIMRKVREEGAEYVNFDADAPVDPALPVLHPDAWAPVR